MTEYEMAMIVGANAKRMERENATRPAPSPRVNGQGRRADR